jgi:polyketide synthase PksN
MSGIDKKRQQIIDVINIHKRTVPAAQTISASANRIGDEDSQRAKQDHLPIAIIGLSGYLPGCLSVKEFWQFLDQDRSLIEEVPKNRFAWETTYDPSATDPMKSHTRWGGFIPQIEDFDPEFFGILATEAERMDPRQRLLLMSVYNTIEDAGYAPMRLRESLTGVFIAIEDNEYLQNLKEAGIQIAEVFSHAPSMVANLISHFFDFRGPSEIVNTMCSGTAVALHRAVMALRAGEIDQAVVGAANLILRPDLDISLSRLRQLSSSRTVKSFGERASGYLRAEGVGSVLLKPLSRAEADGDPIYALIKNSAVNFNGRGGTSIAAPDVASHCELIQKCYRAVEIDPRDINYIEAQGMGNQVADIAEWEACNRALIGLAREKGVSLVSGQCRISALKPMIGHMHSASALGALFKIIRSLQTDCIHKIIDFDKPNPFLTLEDQPCRLAIDTEPWPKADRPRLAGLHSYGSGGNNAHLVIEEYRAPQNRGSLGQPLETPRMMNDYLIPLSAESASLRPVVVRRLLETLAQYPKYSLAAIAGTLQQGRDQMRYRIAFVADCETALKRQMQAYLAGEVLAGVYEGIASSHPSSLGSAGSETRPAVNEETQSPSIHQLARDWTIGAVPDLEGVCQRPFKSKIHLPVYPFDKKRCWIETGASASDSSAMASNHPIFHLERIDKEKLRFRMRLTGQEFFLNDHRVNNRKIFPGAAYLESARAVAQASSVLRITKISDVVWLHPVYVDHEFVDVRLELTPEGADSIRYRLTTVSQGGDFREIVHGQGLLWTSPVSRPAEFDLFEIRNLCRRRIEIETLYQALDRVGLNYGRAFRGVRECCFGDREVIARVVLPSMLSIGNEVVLHPSLLDAAWQSGILLLFDWEKNEDRLLEDAGSGIRSEGVMPATVPFSLDEIVIHQALPREFWVYSRISPRSSGRTLSIDSELLDESGCLIASLRGFHARSSHSNPGVRSSPMAHDGWGAPGAGPETVAAQLEFDQLVWVEKEGEEWSDGSDPGIVTQRVSLRFNKHLDIPGSELVALDDLPSHDALIKVVSTLTDKLRAGIAGDTGRQYLLELWCDRTLRSPICDGIVSFIKSVHQEYRHVRGKLIRLDTNGHLDANGSPGGAGRTERLQRIVAFERAQREIDSEVSYWNRKRYIRTSKRLELPQSNPVTILSHLPVLAGKRKIYWIIGGGVLGLHLADWLIEHLDAKVIISSRSVKPGSGPVKINNREYGEDRIRLLRLDVTNRQEMHDQITILCEEERQEIEGIFFTAGKTQPKPIVEKHGVEIRQVIETKCAGATNLLERCSRLPCRFIALFSSQAYQGEYQNSDYAAANGFLNGLVQDLGADAQPAPLINCHGQALLVISVNWPQWQEGGMQLAPELIELMKHSRKVAPLPNRLGFAALRDIIQSGVRQVSVQYRLIGKVNEDHLRTSRSPNREIDVRAEQIIRDVVGGFLKIAPSTLDLEAEFSALGFDSVTVVNLSMILQAQYNIRVQPALFFEYHTPSRLRDYLAALLLKEERPVTNRTIRNVTRNANGQLHTTRSTTMSESRDEPIAIVGIHARFPGADNVDQFWKNIVAGKNCITEIPRSRWDWQKGSAPSNNNAERSRLKWGGFIDGIDEFDPLFFSISPKEAELIDPQQRLLLQSVWSALENGGIAPDEFAQKTVGVFVAAAPGEYKNVVRIPPDHPLGITAVTASMAPNRISHVFNFKGPSEYYDTACSSVLVALHRATQAIHRRECEQAIVAAVNLLLSPEEFIGFEAMEYLSATGLCQPFQDKADGFVRSEGVGSLVLKPLAQALDNEDIIYAVVRGSGLFHGGRGLSLTAPSLNGMKQAMIAAYHYSGIDPRTVSYIEAHGVASPLSDSIEINALTAAFRELEGEFDSSSIPSPQTCYLSSLKPCIGHGELVSGMAALIKAIFALRHRIIPGLPRFTRLHDDISLAETPWRISADNRDWTQLTDLSNQRVPRRAGINSFGFGGVNAHAILEEHLFADRERDRLQEEPTPQIIIFSAKNVDRLKAVVAQSLSFIRLAENLSLPELAYTLQIGRQAFNERLAMVVSCHDELIKNLTFYLGTTSESSDPRSGIYRGSIGRAVLPTDHLLSGTAAEAILEIFIAEKAFDKIAQYWVQGGIVSWRRLHQGKYRRRIPLPTYPFAKDRYWLSAEWAGSGTIDHQGAPDGNYSLSRGQELRELRKRPDGEAYLKDRIREFLSKELNLGQEEISNHISLTDIGADSIILVKLSRALKEWSGFEVSGRELITLRTIASISAYLTERSAALGPEKMPLLGSPVTLANDGQSLDLLDKFKLGAISLEEIETYLEDYLYDLT